MRPALARALALVIVLVPAPVRAAVPAPVSVQLDSVSLAEFAQLVYGEIDPHNYTLSPELLSDPRRVTVEMRAVTPDDVRRSLNDALRRNGFVAAVVPGSARALALVRRSEPAAPERLPLIYHPRARDAAYLVEAAKALFPQTNLGTSRPVSVDQAALPPTPPDTPDAGAYALIERRTDVILARVSESERRELLRALADLDTPPGQVVARAVIYEFNSGSADQSAVGAALKLLSGRLNITVGASLSPDGGYTATIQSGDLDALAGAIDSDNRFRQLSRPTVRALSGQTGRFEAGAQVPTLGAVTLPGQGQPATQSVEYRSAGTILEFTPHVRADLVELQTRVEISSVQPTRSGVNNSPTLLTRNLSTTLQARPGEILLLGGLDQDTGQQGRAGLGFLPRWFGARSRMDDATQILILIQLQTL